MANDRIPPGDSRSCRAAPVSPATDDGPDTEAPAVLAEAARSEAERLRQVVLFCTEADWAPLVALQQPCLSSDDTRNQFGAPQPRTAMNALHRLSMCKNGSSGCNSPAPMSRPWEDNYANGATQLHTPKNPKRCRFNDDLLLGRAVPGVDRNRGFDVGLRQRIRPRAMTRYGSHLAHITSNK